MIIFPQSQETFAEHCRTSCGAGYDRRDGTNNSTRNPHGDAKGATNHPKNNRGQPINRHVYDPSSKKAIKYDATKFYPPQNY